MERSVCFQAFAEAPSLFISANASSAPRVASSLSSSSRVSRARDAAAMYGPGAHRGLGHDRIHGGGHRHGLGLDQLGVRVRAEAESTPEGARIIVRPQVATDLEAMRSPRSSMRPNGTPVVLSRSRARFSIRATDPSNASS